MRKFFKNLATVVVMGVPCWIVLGAILQEESTTLAIKLDEPDVQVEIDANVFNAHSHWIGPIELQAGQHQLKVSKGEEILFTRSINLSPGDHKEIEARWSRERAMPQEQLESAASAPGSSEPPEVLRPLMNLEGHLDAVTGVGFRGDHQAISIGRDHTLRFWELKGGPARNAIDASGFAVKGLIILDDGRRVVTLGDNGLLEILDAVTGESLKKIDCGECGKAVCMTASRDSRYVAVGSEVGSVRLVDLESGESRRVLEMSPIATGSLAFSPDGRTLLVGLMAAPPFKNEILVSDINSRQVTARLPGHRAPVWGLCYLPDGRRAVSVGGDRTMRLWDVPAAKELREFPDQAGVGRCVAVSSDGRYAVAGTGYRWSFEGGWQDAPSYGVTVWDLVENRVAGRYTTNGPVSCVALSPDGKRALAGGADRLVHAFDLPDGTSHSTAVSTTDEPANVPETKPYPNPRNAATKTSSGA